MTGLLGTSMQVNAAYNPVSGPQSSDVFLGIVTTNNPSSAFVLDLGSASTFTSTPAGQTVDFSTLQGYSSTDFGNDLSNLVASNWYNGAVMGVIGNNNGLIIGNANNATGITSPGNGAGITQVYGEISQIANNSFNGGSTATVATGGGDGVAWQSLNSDSGAWNKYHGGVGAVQSPFNGGALGGISYSIFQGDLQSIVGTGLAIDSYSSTGIGTYLGQLNVSSGGAVTFTAAPEPSTYALISFGALLCVILYRRKSANS